MRLDEIVAQCQSIPLRELSTMAKRRAGPIIDEVAPRRKPTTVSLRAARSRYLVLSHWTMDAKRGLVVFAASLGLSPRHSILYVGPSDISVVSRYGLPSEPDVHWIREVAGRGSCCFLATWTRRI